MLIKLPQPRILNAAGQVIRLTDEEQFHADEMQVQVNDRFKRLKNSLGYEVNITTLSTIVKKISEQKFFQVAPAKYLPVRVGDGAWSSNLLTYRSFDAGDEFETGLVNTGGQNARLASADAAVDSITVQVFDWAKSTGWSIIDLQKAAKSGNWDIVSAKEKSRKKNWDLGIQRVAFLGARGQNGASGNCLGLLNQSGITTNTTVITQAISAMDTTALKAFCVAVYEAYRANCQRTAVPTHFIMPESDFNGTASMASPTFPIRSTLDLLLETFKVITGNPEFKILPLAYADATYHADVASIAGKQIYTMLNYDEESLRMDIPVDYTNTLANSLDNFSFQNVAYGEFTGVMAYRPLELLYFTY